MLRATIEIVPFGVEDAKRHILTVEVARTTLREDPEDYNCSVYKDDGELVSQFKILRHSRKDGAHNLIRRAIEVYSEERDNAQVNAAR